MELEGIEVEGALTSHRGFIERNAVCFGTMKKQAARFKEMVRYMSYAKRPLLLTNHIHYFIILFSCFLLYDIH